MAGTTDTVKAILTPGEFVIRKEAVDMIGVPTLEKLNDMPEAGGHSEIDRLIGMATLKNMTGMYGGGEVKTQQYGHGGQVQGYQDGGKTIDVNKYADWAKSVGLNPAYMDTSDSSIVVSTPEQSKMFDDIISKIMFPPKTSKTQQIDTILDMLNTPQYYGLDMGDSVPSSDFLLNRRAQAEKDRKEVKAAEKIYNEMNWLEKKKVSGYQEGGKVSPEMYTSMVRKLIGKLGGEEPEGMYTPEGGLTREGYAKMLGADPESVSIDTLNFKNPANYRFKVSGKGALSGADVGGTTQSRGILPLEGNILDPLMREKMDDPFERMDMEMLLRKIKPQGYQEGGAVQEDAMMQDYLQSLQAQRANPFIPFDQRPPSSGEVMSSTPKGMEQGDYYMSLKNELEMENEELLRDKVQNTFDRIRLDSLLNQWKKGAERIENLPEDTSGFIPTVPMFKPEGMGI